MADHVHHDGIVYAGIFEEGGHRVPQAVKGEGVHGAAFGSFLFSMALFRCEQTGRA